MTRSAQRTALAGVLAATVITSAACSSGPVLTASSGTPFILTGVDNVERVGAITGADGPGRTDKYAVNYTDLGSMFEADGKVWFVFGDTFGERDPDFTGGGGSFWRSNTMGFTSDSDPSDGITIDGMVLDDTGTAAELLPSKKVDDDEMTVIPTHGFAVGDTMYLHWMSVRHWGEPGEWEVNEAGLASSTDDGKTWTVLDEPRWSGESDFVQISPFHVSEGGTDWLYVWGITHGRFGGVALARVKASEVESADAWQYFTGTDAAGAPEWTSDPESATIVVDDTVGELSVVWNDYLDRWIMTYLGGSDVVIREGITPWGPWGDAKTVVSATDVPGLYAPFMLQRYNSGPDIYFTLSVWDPYTVYWYHAELSKAD